MGTFIIALTCLIGMSYAVAGEPWDWSQRPDFSALRVQIGWSDDYRSLCENDRPLRRMVELMNKEKWTKAAELGLPWLQSCPVDIRVHFYTGISLSNAGKGTESEHHIDWMRGLMNSVVASGDGKTPETAYITISVSEEYDVLEIFGLKPVSQGLLQGPSLVDAFTVKDSQGKELEIYFNPSAHFHRVEKMWGPVKMK